MLLKAVLHAKLKNGKLFWFFKICLFSLSGKQRNRRLFSSQKKWNVLSLKKLHSVHHNKLICDRSSSGEFGKLSWSVRNDGRQKSTPPVWHDSRKDAGDFKRMSSSTLSFFFYWNSLKIICSRLHNEPSSVPGAQRQPCAGFLFSSCCEQTAAIKRGKKQNAHKLFLMGCIWRIVCMENKVSVTSALFFFPCINWVPSCLNSTREKVNLDTKNRGCSTFCLQGTF